MASTTAVVPTIHHERPPSIRSISASSTASAGGMSLRRRSRTRTRIPSVRAKSVGAPETRQCGVLGEAHAMPSRDSRVRPPLPAFLQEEPKAIDGALRSAAPQHAGRGTRRPSTAASERGPAVLIQEPPAGRDQQYRRLRQSRSEGSSDRGLRARAASLPRPAFRTNVSSDSSSQPSPCTPAEPAHDIPVVHIAGGNRSNFRDSVLTQVSATSSSLYPASTATGTRTESSLPYTLDSDMDERLGHYSPEIASEKLDFDADDVSYRLRLLVNNSYFLPPAHAKPSPFSLAPPDPAAAKRSGVKSAPGAFLDFFRIGKSKSKPAAPLASPPALDPPSGPILRTTSDSSTASGFVQRPHALSLPQTPLHPIPPASANRVVVVRERVVDLAAAAHEAEKELRSRSAVRNTRSRSTSRGVDSLIDVIDPTDAVDLPPPPPSYPFAAQASAMHGLGVQESVGAAVLAEQLPPGSPGIWSSSTEDDTWRKALLREAVSHSLSSSADVSFATSTDRSAFPSPTPASPRTTSSFPGLYPSVSSPGPYQSVSPPPPKYKIGQPILDLTISTEREPPSPTTPTQATQLPLTGNSLSTFSSQATFEPRHPSWYVPGSPPRAESPTQSHYPLAPPPRKRLVNPLFSLSQPDLSDPGPREHGDGAVPGSSRPSLQGLRKAMSSPILSDAHDASGPAELHDLSLSPPPTSMHQRLSPTSAAFSYDLRATPSFSSYRSMMSGLEHSDDDDDVALYATPADTDLDEPVGPRPSVTVSLVTEARPSLSISEYSNPSPTASAFHDAIFGSFRPPSTISRRSFAAERSPGSSAQPTFAPPPSRSLAISPPPRLSSSATPTILPPPPRMPAARPVYRPSLSSRASTEPSRRSLALSRHSAETDPLHDAAAEVPPLPSGFAERRGTLSTLSLRIPTEDVPAAIHSAPAPASPTEFFDRIEATLDELDDDDESDEDDAGVPSPPPPSRSQEDLDLAQALGRPRAPFMRMGNHSSPQLAPPSSLDGGSPTLDPSERKKPISNIPPKPRRGSYFSSKKRGLANTDIPLLPFAELAASSSQKASSAASGSTPRRRRPATANDTEKKSKRSQRESLQKFDGMLLQHLAAERTRIKQITSNVSSGSRG